MTFSPKFFDYMKHNCIHIHGSILRTPKSDTALPKQGLRTEPAVNPHHLVVIVEWTEEGCDSMRLDN